MAVPGVEATTVASDRFADHLVFRTAGNPALAPLALLGHLDTVFPPGVFEGYRVDGALRRGPGVLDMKGGLVVVAFALRGLAEAYPGGLAALPPLRIVVVADEEVGSPEGAGVIRAIIGGCAASLVLESGRAADAIITRRKGTGAVTAVAHGKAPMPATRTPRAKTPSGRSRGGSTPCAAHRLRPPVTVNVGKVSGGQGRTPCPTGPKPRRSAT
jgi:glutamate carboxypeptidase